MQHSSRPIVKPRVRLGDSNSSFLLVDVIQSMLADGQYGLLRLIAPEGYGKSTALEYLVHVPDPRLVLHDQGKITQFPLCPSGTTGSLIVVVTTPELLERYPTLHLLPWCKDDCIEYCLLVDKAKTASAITRLGDDGELLLNGSPFLCRLVLDEFLQDERVPNSRVALERIFGRANLDDVSLARVFRQCVRKLTDAPIQAASAQNELDGINEQIVRLFHHPVFCHFVVVRTLLQWLRDASKQSFDASPSNLAVEDEVTDPPVPEEIPKTGTFRSRSHHAVHYGRVLARAALTACRKILAAIHSLRSLVSKRNPPIDLLQTNAEPSRGEPTCSFDLSQIPLHIAEEVADMILKEEIPCFDTLRRCLDQPLQNGSALAATLLSRCGEKHSVVSALSSRRPKGIAPIDLTQAKLNDLNIRHRKIRKAKLKGAKLEHTNFDLSVFSKCNAASASFHSSQVRDCTFLRSDFSATNFSKSQLANVIARYFDLSAAKFADASVNRSYFGRTIFVEADLRESFWTDCTFVDCKFFHSRFDGSLFRRCNFHSCDLHDFEFQEATVQDCQFLHSDLHGCNMERMAMDGISFAHSYFYRADLTGTKIHQGNFENTNFMHARLAEIDWEGANLRNADLRHVDFHMGTTRSGLIDSDIACEGSRTGFYTDDYLDMTFRAPEEIRKANLVGADLRGADLNFTDFYLVDLRRALLDPNQIKYLRGCRAIL